MLNMTDKSSQKTGKNGKSGIPKEHLILAIVFGVVLIITATIVLFVVFGGQRVDQTKYSISYVVNAGPEAAGLEVDVNFDVKELSTDRMIFLYKGLVSALWHGCSDASGKEVAFSEIDDLIAIGPIDENTKNLSFKYYVGIGVTETDSTYETSYTYGGIFDDLLSFSGEYALLMPFLDPESFDSVDKYINSVSIDFITPSGWQAIIPYQTPLDGSHSITISSPSWDFFNSISKSAFCFGYFEKFDYGGIFDEELVYIDKAIATEINQYALDAFVTFLDYYTTVFGEPLDDVPIVLLRNHPVDGAVITGGVGSRGSAVSINMSLADDFKTLSNVVYHTFFDSKVKSRNLRYVTNDWIYKGLANFYVDHTAEYLPEHVRDTYSINLGINQSELYLKYLYFSLKEPGFLALSPSDESVMYEAQKEFYMNVKVPLLIDTINHSIEQNTGQVNGFVKELVKRGSEQKLLDVEKMMREVCGKDYEAIKMYIAGIALIPNYNNLNADNISDEEIIYILDQDEQYYAYLFNRKNIYYPYSPVFLLNEEEFMAEAAKRGIRYNTDEIQAEVKAFSSVLDRVLLQYAMWASLAEIDDVTAPNIIRKLSQPEIYEQWTIFCEEIGYEIGIRSSIKG